MAAFIAYLGLYAGTYRLALFWDGFTTDWCFDLAVLTYIAVSVGSSADFAFYLVFITNATSGLHRVY
jgi:hypothetical protein